jgi:hypothetical protein
MLSNMLELIDFWRLSSLTFPVSPIPEADMKNFEEKVAEKTAAELSVAAVAAAAAEPVPVTAENYVLKTIDKSKIVP